MVTSVCFGTSGLGDMPDTYGYGVDDARARATLHAIFDGPANFIDTSRNGRRHFCSVRCANHVNVANHRLRRRQALAR